MTVKQAAVETSEINSVRSYLQARINPSVVATLDATLRLAWPTADPESHDQAEGLGQNQIEGHAGLNFELKQGELLWLEASAPAQATFWFRDAEDVQHLLSGSDSAYADFMARFMAAELSSDGYLPWAFTLLSLFRGGPGLATPS